MSNEEAASPKVPTVEKFTEERTDLIEDIQKNITEKNNGSFFLSAADVTEVYQKHFAITNSQFAKFDQARSDVVTALGVVLTDKLVNKVKEAKDAGNDPAELDSISIRANTVGGGSVVVTGYPVQKHANPQAFVKNEEGNRVQRLDENGVPVPETIIRHGKIRVEERRSTAVLSALGEYASEKVRKAIEG